MGVVEVGVKVDVDALLVVIMLEVEIVELDEVVGVTMMQLQALDIL